MLRTYSKIINSKEYKSWKEKNPKSFLSSIFYDEINWQFNFFYNDKLITFLIEDSKVKTEESNAQKLENLKELDLNEIKITFKNVDKIMNKIVKEKNEKINKRIVILQKKDLPIWNLTYITKSLNFFNVKINAINGEVIEKKFENILNLKANPN